MEAAFRERIRTNVVEIVFAYEYMNIPMISVYLVPFASNPHSKLDIPLHDGDTVSVDGAKVGILEETDKVSFGGFLESSDGAGLEPKVTTESGGDFSDEPLEWELPDEELSALLVLPDFSEGDGTWAESVLLLGTLGVNDWGGLAGSLGTERLPWGLTTSGLSCGLLSTSHSQE